MAIMNVNQRVNREKYDAGFDMAFGNTKEISSLMDKVRDMSGVMIDVVPATDISQDNTSALLNSIVSDQDKSV